jgi:hypothetical protein
MFHQLPNRDRRSQRLTSVVKPSCSIHPRVQAASTERLGILAVERAKHRSKWLLADFSVSPLSVTARASATFSAR